MSWIPSDDYDCQDNTTTMEFEWGKDSEFYVEATIEWNFEGFDGIGSYEYWGQKCYDQGSPVYEIGLIEISVFDSEGNEITPSPEERKEIESHIINNAEPDFD
jgi:hypothetical protein